MIGLTVVTAWLRTISLPGSRVDGCPDTCATLPQRGDGTLRVMALNVLHGFPHHERLRELLDLIADEILRQEVEMACLQEVPWALRLESGARRLGVKTGMNQLYLRANGSRWAIANEEGLAILSRFPLQQASLYQLRPRASLSGNRLVLRAVLATPWSEVSMCAIRLTETRRSPGRSSPRSPPTCLGALPLSLSLQET